ncbi:sugar-binding transcriptional regulator [Planomicrobium sp. YIM 101495]|uniref:sugar-binding transcriptional regulator n=1 Tax=Planomicrobium sp. YIM 101495 TaxID=2665160 RepID=UPI0012B9E434|nr:sugar-binding transcriptional regulator [Planomicrobium sp. YIM 101495]MTD31958.1 RNA polymerase subunit sigma-70 [Planomicrobium sp. YIM 101495]
MIDEKDLMSIEVARMYYEFDKTQQEIAETLSISRPTVSKLLKHAKEKNFIQITIESPVDAIGSLEQGLKEKFGLKDAKVAYVSRSRMRDVDFDLRNLLGKVTAEYLADIVKDDDRIGLSWGETLFQVSQELKPKSLQGVEVVQLKGGMNLVEAGTHDQEIMMQFVKNFNAKGQYIPLPVVFETEAAKQTMLNQKQTQKIIDKISGINIALYTIGTVTKASLLHRMHYTTDEEFAYLEEHAICDICSRFIDEHGEICLEDLDARTFGIGLDKLAEVENSILVAGGEEKLEGIYVALQKKIPNVLITNSMTAIKLLEH